MPFTKNGGSHKTQSRTNQNAQTPAQTQSKRKLDKLKMQKDKKNKKRKLSSQTTEKRKEQKRKSMQRAREKIRNDPVRFEEDKAKERERYHRRKKAIGEMSERMKRSVRKKWKNQKRNQREKVKKQCIFEEHLREDSPPESPHSTHANITPRISPSPIARPSGSSSSRLESGRKRAKKNSERLRKENLKLREENKKIVRKLEKYKKRMQRSMNAKSKNTIDSETPRKKVKKLIAEANPKEIEKRILFGEVIKEQLKESFKVEKSKEKRKQVLQALTGKITRKYKYLEHIRSITSKKFGRIHKTSQIFPNEERMLRSSKIKLAIQKFLETDEASKMCAGKKETITRYMIKKQKRYLNNTLLNLIKIFKKENPSFTNISYRTFCRYRPFWVLYPTIKDRETCLCKTHENMALVVNKLNYSKIIKERTADEVVKKMCCEEKGRECLERTCEKCKEKKIEPIEFEDETIKYKKWVTKKMPAIIHRKEKLVQKTMKMEYITSKNKLFEILCVDILKFMRHMSNINHQYEQLKKIKENLSPRDILLHFDFSENFVLKYAKEIQATHFGASKHQVTIHTAVLYSYTEKPKCVATVSDCNRHDPSAVSAHLLHLIDHMKTCVPKPRCVHFLSDGAPTQYKNKNMFYLFFHKLIKQLQCEEVNWHFYESGHGKGAADGVGATLKRTADKLIAMGIDIPNSEILVTELKENCKGIIVERVEENEVLNVDLLLPKTIQPFKGTMKIRQIKWVKNSTVLQVRRLTCLNCRSHCTHFNLGVIKVLEDIKPIYDPAGSQSLQTEFPSIQFAELSTGMWVVVEFEGILYPGEIVRIKSKEHIEVSVMHLIRDGQFSWPEKTDLIPYPLSDVKAVIKPPIPTASGSRKINYIFPEYQNILFP